MCSLSAGKEKQRGDEASWNKAKDSISAIFHWGIRSTSSPIIRQIVAMVPTWGGCHMTWSSLRKGGREGFFGGKCPVLLSVSLSRSLTSNVSSPFLLTHSPSLFRGVDSVFVREPKTAMKIAILLIAACGTSKSAAFAPPATQFQVKVMNPTVLMALDPSMISDPTVLAAGAGTFIAIAYANFRKGSSDTSSSMNGISTIPSKVDLSIPYDAAANLAYNAYAESSTKEVDFNKFKEIYEAQMVAEVKTKVKVEKVNERKSEIQALEEHLAAMKSELAGIESDAVSLNDEVISYKNELQALFNA